MTTDRACLESLRQQHRLPTAAASGTRPTGAQVTDGAATRCRRRRSGATP